jgi:GDP-L-fucose synthase
MINILVTGSNGLVGNSLKTILGTFGDSNTFILGNYRWHFLNNSGQKWDLRDPLHVDTIFKNYNPHIVIHLASKVAGLYGNINFNYTMLSDNLKININILDACKKYNVNKLINMLSTCVFPDSAVYPLTSNQVLNGDSHESNKGYSYSKRILYIGGQMLYHTTVVNIIPTNLFGNNDNYNLENSHVIPGLIHRCYLAKRDNTDLVIRGSGSALRQFVYSDDLAKIIISSIDLDKSHTFIVAPPIESEITIISLVNKITKAMDFTGNIVFDNTYADGQISKTSSSDELISTFPDFQFSDFDTSLKSVIDHFCKNYNSLRK